VRNPLRSEADAFRFLLTIGVAAAAVIAVTLLTRPLFGALLGLVLLGVALRAAWRGLTAWRAEGAEHRVREEAEEKRLLRGLDQEVDQRL